MKILVANPNTSAGVTDLLVASEEIDATEDADRFCAGLESANIYEIAPALKGTP